MQRQWAFTGFVLLAIATGVHAKTSTGYLDQGDNSRQLLHTDEQRAPRSRPGAGFRVGRGPGFGRVGRMARGYASVNFDVLDRIARDFVGHSSASAQAGGGVHHSIPHVLHQNFMGGRAALEREVLKPHSYFRRDWWRSCQTHHPEWTHVFWDAASARRLLRERYRWFLPTWDNYTSVVLRSDSLRAFILHAFGGVYLDLDTECFRPMDDSLAGYQAVFMAETAELVNNAQMASAPGHPVWLPYQRAMAANAAAGIFGPVRSTGPMPLSSALKSVVGDKDADKLRVEYRHDASGTTARVYSFGEWFTPCSWNNASCGLDFERYHRTRMRQQQRLVGKHHYTYSWRPGSDNTVALRRMNAGIQGIVEFLMDSERFAEYSCRRRLTLDGATGAPLTTKVGATAAARSLAAAAGRSTTAGSGTTAAAAQSASAPFQLCGEQFIRSVKNGSCLALSIRQSHSGFNSAAAASAPRLYTLENTLAQYGCSVLLYSDRAVQGGLQSTAGPGAGPSAAELGLRSSVGAAVAADGHLDGTVRVETAALGTSDDPFAELPVLSLRTVLQQTESNRVTVAYIDCGSCVWHVLNHLYVQGLGVLCHVDTLVLDLGPLLTRHKHHVHAMYQHLWQELGFLGLHTVPLGYRHLENGGTGGVGGLFADGLGGEGQGRNGSAGGRQAEELDGLRVTLVNTGHHCRRRAALLLQRRHEQHAGEGGHMHGAGHQA